MGVSIGSSMREGCDCSSCGVIAQPTVNPDPSKFRITKSSGTTHFSLVMAVYEGCTNYEGRKIMLLSIPEREAKHLHRLDPHFNEKDQLVIARFMPSQAGWDMGVELLNQLQRAFDTRQRKRKRVGS